MADSDMTDDLIFDQLGKYTGLRKGPTLHRGYGKSDAAKAPPRPTASATQTDDEVQMPATFICRMDSVQQLVENINNHALLCGGKLSYNRRGLKVKGLAGNRDNLTYMIEQGGLRAYALAEKSRMEEAAFQSLRQRQALMVTIDVGHNKGRLMDRVLYKLIREEKLDVATASIDDNKSNAKKIESYTRENATNPELRACPVMAKNDTFHFGHNNGKNAAKEAGVDLGVLDVFFKHRVKATNSEVDVAAVVGGIIDGLRAKAESFFLPLKTTFASPIAKEWLTICHCPRAITQFAVDHDLVDKQPPGDWTEVLAAWNQSLSEDRKLRSILQLSYSTVAAALMPLVRALAQKISKHVSIAETVGQSTHISGPDAPIPLLEAARKAIVTKLFNGDPGKATAAAIKALSALQSQIGYQAWVTRLPCFTKHLKRMLMSVDQTYGSFSLQFKMWVVLTGLCNFGDHYCGDHTNCSGFIWWGTCSLGDHT
ncbi:hypothetical protein B484DRAFT_404870 [Ochromonadaceae sp. CCMP2298]|nr:hypothetical protein B484DRAFT_404870 [Ochromonadaceae sp. CCMP2298]